MKISQTNLIATADELDNAAVRASNAAAAIRQHIEDERDNVLNDLVAPDGGPDPFGSFEATKSPIAVGSSPVTASATSCSLTNEALIDVRSLAGPYTGPIERAMRFLIGNDTVHCSAEPATVLITALEHGYVRFLIEKGSVYTPPHGKMFAHYAWGLPEEEFRARAQPYQRPTIGISLPTSIQRSINETKLEAVEQLKSFAASPNWSEIAPDLLLAARFVADEGDPTLTEEQADRIAVRLRGLVSLYAPEAIFEELKRAGVAAAKGDERPKPDTESRARARDGDL